MTERGAMAPVVLGEFAGVYGVKGWLRIRSYTQPIDNILGKAFLLYWSWNAQEFQPRWDRVGQLIP